MGVGGRDNETITKVFELSEEQRVNLKNWSAELKVRNDILKDKAKFLMKKNEESSPEVLLKVSKEYATIMDSMKQNVRMIDQRLLNSFNDVQYDRYLKLCRQLTLRPIHINRSVDEN
ncbi:hypothetical protein [Flagellimonas okinawensis]|uniref:Uncharacterized protein n=1 Tax=Flagellimonas okinawensis TaxID=3031324 RepID=A0ABT5XKN0_9FLAO|nr:hypothetical protein [[Muricauda] okinawensis]MDF0706438.1 hypothetical protein [[Muricauda] okinawensis]